MTDLGFFDSLSRYHRFTGWRDKLELPPLTLKTYASSLQFFLIVRKPIYGMVKRSS
jgi:hypothetical protein